MRKSDSDPHMALGAVGVWSIDLRFHPDHGASAEAAAVLEELGYGTLWIPGGVGGGLLDDVRRLLAATGSVNVATGILNIWMHDPVEVASLCGQIEADHAGRLVLGLGRSHAALVDGSGEGERYSRPLAAMAGFLDVLDQEAVPAVAVDRRLLGAVGPRSLEMAQARSAGTHPYFMPVEHTRYARELLGPDVVIAPEQAVILDDDPASARATARNYMAMYLTLPNYTDNLGRFGFTDADLAGGGSDRLVDAIVAWGDESAIAARIAAHHAAGADHVAVQVLGAPEGELPLEAWRRLAPALVG